MIDSLEAINFFNSIDKKRVEIIHSLFTQKSVKKNTVLLAEGQVCKQNYIIQNGVARKFFHHSDREITTEIYLKGDIAFSFESFTCQTKSNENIVAVTDLDLLCLGYHEFAEAKTKFPWLVQYDLHFVEHYTIQLEHKLKEQAVLNAAERYKKILISHPKLIQEVPLKVIASYLNISSERLSRIRAQI